MAPCGWGRAAEPAAPVDTSAIAPIVEAFVTKFKVPGLSVAIARRGEFVLQQGYGVADSATRALVTPAHVFRIASISKPITSAALFALIEQGRCGLDDRVFGENGRLGFDFGRQLPGRVQEITVCHLLTHTSGGWGNKANDPMFREVALTQRELIESTLRELPLTHAPGTNYAYSNFGYCVLGRLVEKLTGQPYAEVVEREVLAKCGITSMRLGGNTRAERVAHEVTYHAEGRGDPYRMNVTRMDAHGGWIATATDLVRFALAVDGMSPARNILQPETIRRMTAPSTVNPNYACGWAVNRAPNWWHGGSLPGTATLLVRTASGFCWAALANTRTEGIGPALDRLMWQIVRAVPAWQT
jgi:CubicO group peptidase (beta-lactamase class C family)